jgi:four helix bundle protein
MDLVESVYQLTSSFSREELYGLSGQLRRAVVSVPANIAEGQGRDTVREFRRFRSIAHGSLREVETLVHIAFRLKYIEVGPKVGIHAQPAEVGGFIKGLSNSLLRKPNTS